MALRAWLCVAATLAMPVDEDLPCAWVRSSTSDRCVAPPMARRTCSVTLAQCEARYAPLLARIARDLAPWEATGITDAMVDARAARRSAVGDDLWLGARNGTLAVARVKPKGYKGRGHKAYAHLKRALETVCDVPDGSILYSTSDHAPDLAHVDGAAPSHAPLHVFCARRADRLSVLAPEAPSFGVDYDAIVAKLRDNANKSGDDRLWFAGKVAGPGNEARAAAGRLASARPDLLDVRLSAGDARVGAEDQCRHAFALYLHGSACSGRLKRLVHCGSAIVFPKAAGGVVPDGQYEEFFYDALIEPGRTVVPAADVADLERVMDEARADPAPARRAAAELDRRAAALLSEESVACYWATLFRENARLRRKGASRS